MTSFLRDYDCPCSLSACGHAQAGHFQNDRLWVLEISHKEDHCETGKEHFCNPVGDD